MPSTSIKINTTAQDGKKISTTVANINGSVSSATLIQFARKLNAFTSNVYESTEKIVTTKLDTEGGE